MGLYTVIVNITQPHTHTHTLSAQSYLFTFRQLGEKNTTRPVRTSNKLIQSVLVFPAYDLTTAGFVPLCHVTDTD